MEASLKCLPCTDDLIASGRSYPEDAELPAADTMAPLVQTFTAAGQQIMAPLMVPVCFTCRRKQLAPLSKTGLIT